MLLKIINRRLFLSLLLLPNLAVADQLNQADTAWVLTSTALVLFMTIPGLSLFYAGLVRSKNVLSVLMQCFAITCLVSILWLAGVYSFIFSDGGELQKFIGGASRVFLPGIGVASLKGTIPESVFFMFEMTFAIITPALISCFKKTGVEAPSDYHSEGNSITLMTITQLPSLEGTG